MKSKLIISLYEGSAVVTGRGRLSHHNVKISYNRHSVPKILSKYHNVCTFQCIIGNTLLLPQYIVIKKELDYIKTSQRQYYIEQFRQYRDGFDTTLRRNTLIRVETSPRRPIHPPLSLSLLLPLTVSNWGPGQSQEAYTIMEAK